MRVLIMAAGAVGGYYGGLLARHGNDVLFIARGPNLDAIRRDGLKVESVTSGAFSVRNAVAAERPDGTWIADLVLFCVKGYHNAAAIETIALAVGERTAILTLQNGLGSGDELAAAFGGHRVLLGAAYVDASRPAPGVFREQGGVCRIVFAERGGARSERCAEVSSALADAGIESEVTDDIDRALWNKLVYICGLSGMTCITRSSFAEVMNTPQTAEMTRLVVAEAAAVGRAAGVNLTPDVVEDTMSILSADREHLLSSMHTDLDAGRPLELGNLNGKVVELGRLHEIETPANEFITACLTPANIRALREAASDAR